MSVASEVLRIKQNIASAYEVCEGKGATLPETQNSANLATTISNIPAGGGGSSAKDLVTSFIDSIEAPYTYSDANNDGWILSTYARNNPKLNFVRKTDTDDSMVGVVLADNFDAKIYFDQAMAIKVPEDAVVTDVGEGTTYRGTKFEVDFSNCEEKWFILRWYSLNGPSAAGSAHTSFSITNSSSTDIARYVQVIRGIVFLKARLFYQNYTAETPMTFYASNKNTFPERCAEFSAVLEDMDLGDNIVFRIGNSTYPDRINWGSYSTIPYLVAPLSHSFRLKKFMDKYFTGVKYGETQLSSTVTKNIFASNNYGAVSRVRCFPFVLDCSGFTAGPYTWYIASAGAYTDNSQLLHYEAPYEWFIIAPDNNVTWGGDRIGYSGTPYTPISLASLKFFAQNAPTVSGRTFTIGEGNYKMLESQAPEAITTLNSKGWTVTA